MIGFSLVAEAWLPHSEGLPHAAIGFSVLIGSSTSSPSAVPCAMRRASPLRERTTAAIFKLMGGTGAQPTRRKDEERCRLSPRWFR